MDYKDYKTGQKSSNFWFKAKHKLLNNLIKSLRKKDLKILDLGAGTGDSLKILNKYGRVYVLDINKKALELVPKHLCKEKKQGDVCNMPYQNDFFDLVVSLDVFEHVENDKKAVSEVYRVLKNNGSLVFTVPAFPFLFSAHDRGLNHKRRYSKTRLIKLMKEFKILKMNYWNISLFLPIFIKRLFIQNRYKSKVDNMNLPNIIDTLFYLLICSELSLLKINFPFPFGISLFGICKKLNKNK